MAIFALPMSLIATSPPRSPIPPPHHAKHFPVTVNSYGTSGRLFLGGLDSKRNTEREINKCRPEIAPLIFLTRWGINRRFSC